MSRRFLNLCEGCILTGNAGILTGNAGILAGNAGVLARNMSPQGSKPPCYCNVLYFRHLNKGFANERKEKLFLFAYDIAVGT